MGWGTGNLGGGSGGGLNFNVVGNPQPESPKENTIWLNTDVPIGAWYFAAPQPENMAEGEVWFPTGTSSPVAFSATKKNPVMVYPLSAKQMVSGSLVDVEAKSYQGGQWTDWWNGELYDSGNEYTGVTGGWVGYAPGSGGKIPTITRNADSLSFDSSASSQTGITTANKIDLTDFSTLTLNAKSSSGDIWLSLTQNLSEEPSNYPAKVNLASTSFADVTLDVSSLNGEYYPTIRTWTGSVVTVTMRRMYLSK